MAQAATPIGRREELYNRIVTAIGQMPDDLREVFVKTHYQDCDLARVATQIGVTKGQLVNCRDVADDVFYSNLHGRRLRLLR